ncbi:MAG: 3-deoxy-7-phosphoheptulonate synthase [Spirochaetes bacterium]|nr:3-deoxy-7-phosphoheptulonate synthase [Spirochaetota bacterium]
MRKTNNINVIEMTPLITPRQLMEEFPMTEASNETVIKSRRNIRNIISQNDKRLLVIVGPCSIHQKAAALEYAEKLNRLKKAVEDKIYIVMRVYFEKPRTSLGWRGMIIDPDINGAYDISNGLRKARNILQEITSMGLPAGSEMLDPIVPQYISDFISWASIGARTTESQTHREMASGLSMPVGFKNSTDGTLDSAVNGIAAACSARKFIGIDKEGRTAIIETKGNPDGHIILRGGKNGPNYHEEKVEEAEALLLNAGLQPAILIDCSHANSGKKSNRQERVLRSLLEQRKHGHQSLIGFMLESNLKCGKQNIPENLSQLEYGVSITDDCISWEDTEELIYRTADQIMI